MKVSIITTPFNAEKTIEETILSVLNQTYGDIEYIIIDGKSSDKTMDIVNRYKDRISHIVSEPDNGQYEAKNKGIRLASGDVIGFLNADDFYTTGEVVEKIMRVFLDKDVDCMWADVIHINSKDEKTEKEKVIRYWRSSSYRNGLFERGWMPPHSTFFAKRWVYEKHGGFNTDFKISADYEIMLRFLHKYRISGYYLPEVLIKMRVGGASNGNIKRIANKTAEDFRVLKMHDFKGPLSTVFLKNITKIPMFLSRRQWPARGGAQEKSFGETA